MATCSTCGADVPAAARYCPACGAEQRAHTSPPPPSPLLAFLPRQFAPAFEAAGPIASGVPDVGPPLTTRQVAVAVGTILLVLVAMLIISGHARRDESPLVGSRGLPVLGVAGESVRVGDTALGVAFVSTPHTFNHRAARAGALLAVGVVVGNGGRTAITLSTASLALYDAAHDTRYLPVDSAWGRPEALHAEQYQPSYQLTPRQLVAGIVVFDVPLTLTHPQLLVRDLTVPSPAYTGTIDLMKRAD